MDIDGVKPFRDYGFSTTFSGQPKLPALLPSLRDITASRF